MITAAMVAWGALCALVLAHPFLIPAQRAPAAGGARRVEGLSERKELLEQKRALYRELRDLELDHATGKLSPDDYRTQRERLVDSAAAVLKTLERTAAPAAEPAAVPGLAAAPAAAVPAPEPEARFCTACGTRRTPEDRFCRHCGQPLT